MPSRPRTSKVTKPNGSSRNRKSLSNNAQQDQYVAANGNTNGQSSIESHTPLAPGRLAPPQSSPGTGGDGERDNFSFTTQPSPYPLLTSRRYQTAADIAYSKYGDAVKLDSALCKKVAGEEAKRPPTQRRQEQKLNIDRRSNMEAFLAHMTGQVAERPCKNCHKGHGPWTECVVYDGQMCGSCTNCWYNASGSRCTFHGSATANEPAAALAVPLPDVPTEVPDEVSSNNLPYYMSPKDDPKPVSDWATPHADTESTVSSQSQPRVPEPLPMPQPPFMDYHPPPMPHGLPTMGMVVNDHEMTNAWAVTDPTRRLIHQAMGDVSRLTRRDRYIARIETAAEELAMRVAEFNEYMRTSDGMADYYHFQQAMNAQVMAHGHAHDARMESIPQGHMHDARMETLEAESVHGSSMAQTPR